MWLVRFGNRCNFHPRKDGDYSGTVLDADIIIFQIVTHHFSHCCFLWAVFSFCHKNTSKLSNSILHQFGGLHKLWDTPITVTARHVKNRRLAACLRLCFYLFWKSSFVHDTQLPIDLAPVPDGSCPFLSSLESGQI